MRLKRPLLLIHLPVILWLCFASYIEAADSERDRILRTFREYEALNADFLSSVGHGKGKSGKSYAVLRHEVEAYSEGPFETALDAAQTQVCKFKDTEVIKALFRVILATANSASESPAWTLGYIFVCQSDLVAKSFRELTLIKQQELFPTLEFGFENAVYEEPKDSRRVLELRRKLQALNPGGKQ
jgi:hypothetical protein